MVEFIAEFTTNHMGNLNVALRMAEEAEKAGATYVKMQKKDVLNFYSVDKLETRFDSPYGHTYGEYRTIFEWDKEQWDIFDKYCPLPWYSTVQDEASLDFMLEYDLPMYKIASSNARNWRFIETIVSKIPKSKKIVISVAGSTRKEIFEAVNYLEDFDTIYVQHCVAEYPCKDKNLRLGNILHLKRMFNHYDNVVIGYSGHEEGHIPTLVAYLYGADIIERHFTLSRTGFVHHLETALEPAEFMEMVRNIRYLEERGRLAIEAYDSDFGMSDTEETFLVNKVYGKDFLGEKSVIK